LPQREPYAAKIEMLLSDEHFTALCPVITSCSFILTAVKALNAQATHGTSSERSGANSAQRGRILMLVAT